MLFFDSLMRFPKIILWVGSILMLGLAGRAQGAATLTTLFVFDDTNDARPYSGVIQGVDGNLDGTVSDEYGTINLGAVFSITTNGIYTNLMVFNGANGQYPYAGLVQASDGGLYGTTYDGGSNGYGTVFRVTTNGGFTSLHSFNSTDGEEPRSGLIQGSDGSLYGTTKGDGLHGYGTIFKITTNGALTTLFSFGLTNGAFPVGALVQAGDGSLYGTASCGGTYQFGTVFRLATNGVFTNLCSFNGANGAFPWSQLTPDGWGDFLGTTEAGGAYYYEGPTIESATGSGTNGYGTVFRITTNGVLTTLHSFDDADGAYSLNGLVPASDGNFYGTTFNGGPDNLGQGFGGYGTVYQLTPDGRFNTVFYFRGTNGTSPGPLAQGADGSFYGTTVAGDGVTGGTIFQLSLPLTASPGVPPFIISPPVSETNVDGATATFPVLAEGTGPLAYQWLRSGTALFNIGNASGANTATLTLTNVSFSDVAGYSVIVSNAFGSVTSSVATLNTTVPPFNYEWQTNPVSLFNYAIFYNSLLEFIDTATMSVRGPVQANGNIYDAPGAGATLTFYDNVSATGSIQLLPTSSSGSYLTWGGYSSAGLNMSGVTNLSTVETNVPAIYLSLSTNVISASPLQILYPPPAGGDGSNTNLAQSRFYNKAEMIILVSNTTVTASVQQPFGGTPTAIPWTNNLALFVNTNVSFTDQREAQSGKVVKLTQIDIGKYNAWAYTNKTVGSVLGSNITFLSSNSLVPNVLYVADFRTAGISSNLYAVRLTNGLVLPTNNFGLTIATPNPLYILGNYNCTNSSYLGTTNTTASMPAALYCDAVTILSSNWASGNYDSESSSAYTTRPAGSTTINAAMVAGVVYSGGTNGLPYSGGVGNFPRLLENWSGTTLTLNTSIVNLFGSVMATNIWQASGNYYTPPVRNWTYDSNHFSGLYNQPPGTPLLMSPVEIVSNPVIITNQPQSQILLIGQNVTFTVGATDSPDLNVSPPINPVLFYRWYFNTNPITATNNGDSITLTNIQLTNAGNYWVAVTSHAYGSVTSSVAVLSISNLPPVAGTPVFYRAGNISLLISFANILASCSDPAGSAITLTGISPVTTNGVTLITNSTLIYYANTNNVADAFTYTIADGFGGTAAGTVLIEMTQMTGGLSLVNLQTGYPGPGTNTLTFAGVPNDQYILQFATNLTTSPWFTLSTNAAGATGLWSAVDPTATNAQRYYRLATP
jgi:uncharacterized repeat protein (TIGR03803 family)